MRILALILLLFSASYTTVQAQLPFTVSGGDGDTVYFTTEVGYPVTVAVGVTKLIQDTLTIGISGLEAPFTADKSEIVFKSSDDTTIVNVTFTPTTAGYHYGVMYFDAFGYRNTLLLVGSTITSGGARFSSSTDVVDLGTVQGDADTTTTFRLYNHSSTSLTLFWQDASEVFDYEVDGLQSTRVDIEAGTWKDVTVIAYGSKMSPGINETMIYVGDGLAVDPLEPSVTNIPIRISATKTGQPTVYLHISPPSVSLERDDNTNEYIEQSVLIRNIHVEDLEIASINLNGPDASDFTLRMDGPLPMSLQPGDTLLVHVNCTGGDPRVYYTEVVIAGMGMVYGQFTVMAYDTSQQVARPIRMQMSTNDAKIGEVCTAEFRMQDQLPSNVDHGVVALRYNATILVPKTTTIDDEDEIVDGMRTSRFRLDPSGHGIGDVAGEVEFTVVLGNSSQTVMEVVSMDWKHADGSSVGAETEVNGTVVSVIDGEGFELNADPGPLKLSIQPMPVSGSATITYRVGVLPGSTLRLFDQTGAQVMDLSSSLSSSDGQFDATFEGLSNGFYLLQLSSGDYTYVTMVLIE